MIEVATAINNFASQATQDEFVPPSEESVFILTSGQLQDIIAQAIQPLQDELLDLKATVAHLKEDITVLEATANHQEENQLIQLRLIADLRKAQEPQPLQRDRGEILRALIAANGGKMLAKDARQKMHLSKSRFSELLTRMEGDIEKRPYYLDRTQNIIILK
jgi:hypothetical protein